MFHSFRKAPKKSTAITRTKLDYIGESVKGITAKEPSKFLHDKITERFRFGIPDIIYKKIAEKQGTKKRVLQQEIEKENKIKKDTNAEAFGRSSVVSSLFSRRAFT